MHGLEREVKGTSPNKSGGGRVSHGVPTGVPNGVPLTFVLTMSLSVLVLPICK